jgi:hypothetical protein
MDLLHIDAVALPASVFYWTFLCLYHFLEPFLSSLIWRKRIASKCVSQSASVRNFVRPVCNTGRRRRSGQGVALTSISFLRRKYSKKIFGWFNSIHMFTLCRLIVQQNWLFYDLNCVSNRFKFD